MVHQEWTAPVNSFGLTFENLHNNVRSLSLIHSRAENVLYKSYLCCLEKTITSPNYERD